MSQFRFCRLTEQRVIIAENRLRKPDMFLSALDHYFDDDVANCPFEYGNEHLSGHEIFAIRDNGSEKDTVGWKTRVVPNLYHALSTDEEKKSRRIGFCESENGVGAHEVIIETPNHTASMDQYTIEEFENYIKTIIARMDDLKNDIRLEYIQVFKNCGKYGGASMPHPHSQIIATPFIPKNIKEQLKIQKSYFLKHGRSLMGDMVEEEIRVNERVIYENGTFLVFTPYASAFPFEVMVAPKHSIAMMTELTQYQINDLSLAMAFLFKRLYRELGNFPFNLHFFNIPPMNNRNEPEFFYKMDEYGRFFVRITPRIYQIGGFELSTGMHINPIAPELAAKRLKEER
ncbi:MAG: galactose-1-phosphate uridylyltransferase [Sulfuricurvum sp.]|uniref:galactose-1-phosphate uridylyltransferase n=1 Tax=Sulfuricurvum sp. TaxID=2025608 RepID=UPI0025DEFEB8|nr:galactose-1-phosphate uridylyltransferase [Sulfuricurvum sp.]MCK9372337.1 galactose-1-phosphate uridylyltransferase [Sulfuricurvum sp.]